MRVDVSPRQLPVVPGTPAVLTVTVFNTTDVISSHRVHILGVDDRWVRVEPAELALFPEEGGAVVVTITLPAGIPAGTRRLTVQVRELTPPLRTESVELELSVASRQDTQLELNPVSVTGGTRADVSLTVSNLGNEVRSIAFEGEDSEDKVRFEFVPPTMQLDPGEERITRVRLKGKRPIAGAPKVRAITVRARDGGDTIETLGAFIQRPRLTRGMLGLLGLLTAMTVFTAVISLTLGSVVASSTNSRNVLLQVIQAGQSTAGAGSGSISGTVTLLTAGGPVVGVTVQAFIASDVSKPVAATATNDKGAYTLSNLDPASYKVKFLGAGFAELWYPNAITADAAQPVTLEIGKPATGIDVKLGGLPAQISGKVVTDDPTAAAGATVTLRVPGGDDGTGTTAAGVVPQSSTSSSASKTPTGAAGAVVATVTSDASGVFLIDKIPSPSTYELSVSKPGYATARQSLDLGTGEVRTGINIPLRKGDGAINGMVSSSTGPIGGATISVSDGKSTFSTVSLTVGDIGKYSLPELPTPANYSVVVSQPGFTSATLAVTLAAGQIANDVNVTLTPGSGSISGTVSLAANGQTAPEGNVTVTATNGKLTLSTVSLSVGAVGTYTISGLALPDTYTVTFSRDDLISQSRSVTIDPLGTNGVNPTGIDITMSTATTTLTGIVTEAPDPTIANPPPPQPIAEVTVTLTQGSSTYTTVTVTAPTMGAYQLSGLRAGTYSASFSRAGSVSTNALVTLVAGQPKTLNVQIEPLAIISGNVVLDTATGPPASGVQVILYLADQFPVTAAATTTTDVNGNYSFQPKLAPATYIVAFSNPPDTPPQTSTTAFTLAAGQHYIVPTVTVKGA
jgi:hypothetical protein